MYETCLDYYNKQYRVTCQKISNRVGGYYNAEDVVMESFKLAMLYQDGYDQSRGEYPCWFTSILNNARIKFCQDERNLGMCMDVQFDEELHDPVPMDDEDFQLAQLIKEDIASKPILNRNILSSYFIDELTFREIVVKLGVTHGQVNGVVSKFKLEMREKYAS